MPNTESREERDGRVQRAVEQVSRAGEAAFRQLLDDIGIEVEEDIFPEVASHFSVDFVRNSIDLARRVHKHPNEESTMLKERAELVTYRAILAGAGIDAENDEELAGLIDRVGPHWWDHVIEAAKMGSLKAKAEREILNKVILHLYANPRTAEPDSDGATTLEQEGWWRGGFRQALEMVAKGMGLRSPETR